MAVSNPLRVRAWRAVARGKKASPQCPGGLGRLRGHLCLSQPRGVLPPRTQADLAGALGLRARADAYSAALSSRVDSPLLRAGWGSAGSLVACPDVTQTAPGPVGGCQPSFRLGPVGSAVPPSRSVSARQGGPGNR